ncbi:MAG: type I-E CRISPR-associated protein Cas7/Cse4/CasC, partial [Candidatus Aquicultorales bacterium]
IMPELFKGARTRRMVFTLKNRLAEKGIEEACAVVIAEQVADIIETLDSKNDETNVKKIKTLMFFSEAEYDSIAEAITSSEDVKGALVELSDALAQNDEKAKEKALKGMGRILEKKPIAQSIKDAQLKDAADIALFGRMVANDHSLSVEAASMFSHALSTHKVDNEIDFFSAVDDLQSKDEAGAGMTSTLEFNSATYYRFAALNLDMLTDANHLGVLTREEQKSVVRTFLEATIMAIPGARKNSMNGNTVPDHVLGIVREKGHPVQLVNAFESPVRSTHGYVAKSIELLEAEYKKLRDTWGLEAVFDKAIPGISIKDFLDGIIETAFVETLSDEDVETLLDGEVEHV